MTVANRIVSQALHSLCLYEWESGLLVSSSQAEDLKKVILSQKAYVWDNNFSISWKSLSLDHPTNAFILGPTFLREQNNLQGALLKEIKGGRDNVFVFSRENDCICIERLDKYFKDTFKTNIPTSEKFTEAQLKNWNDTDLRQSILEDIREKQKNPSELQTFIANNAKKSTGDFRLSSLVASYCYALFLLEERPGGKEWKKVECNHPNCLGDADLLMMALFFNGSILSGDILLKKMASLAKIQTIPEFFAT